MRYTKYIILLFIFSAIIAGVPVFATDLEKPSNQQTEKVPQTEEKSLRDQDAVAQEEKKTQGKVSMRCLNAQDNLQVYLDSSATVKTAYLDRYQGVIDTLNNIVTRVELNNDADSTQLKDDIRALNEKIANFESNLGDYQAELRSAINLTCTADLGVEELRVELEDIRDIRDQLNTDTTAINDYVRDNVTDTLEDLKMQIERTSVESESETSEEA